MNTWLTDMEGLFQAGVKDINFVPSQWNVLTFRSEIRTELFPKVYLNPSDLWIKEQEQLIGTMITAATFQTLEGKKVNTVEENLDENIKYHVYENGLLIKEYAVGQTVFYEVVSKVEYKAKEIVQADKTKESNGLDRFQTVLDIAGLVPVFGEAADGVNGIIYAARGDALNATLSLGAMIPFAGWASTGGKFAIKGNNLNQVRNVVSTEKMESIYSPIYQDVVNSSLGKTQNQLDFLTTTHYQLGTPNILTFKMPPVKTDVPTTIKIGDIKTDIKSVDVGSKGTVNPWKPGEPNDAPTRGGNYPSWGTAKKRHWKNRTNSSSEDEFSPENLERMKKGKPPLHDEVEVPQELHHKKGRNVPKPHNSENLEELWPWEHDAVDPFRHYRGPRPKGE